MFMTDETKAKLIKIGKTIGVGFIGAVVAAGVLVGAYFLKGRGGSASCSSGE
jgi:UPF0716 family protein affecting phage T7 exclusion